MHEPASFAAGWRQRWTTASYYISTTLRDAISQQAATRL